MEKKLQETILKGIKEKRTLILSAKHGLGESIDEIEFEPYILGNDTFQFPFIWGYITNTGLFYRFYLENILSAKLENKNFKISTDACYQYAIEEEHFAIVDGFSNIYSQGAKT